MNHTVFPEGFIMSRFIFLMFIVLNEIIDMQVPSTNVAGLHFMTLSLPDFD